MKLVNPFESEGRWFKANLHTHTSRSDGDSTARERVEQYREKGYDVLAITDHWVTNDVEGLSGEDFLVISGIEGDAECGENKRCHLVGLDVEQGLELNYRQDAKTQIEAIKDAGGEVVFAHPYWSGNNINEMLAVDGYMAVEVFNSTCTKIGKGFGSVHWDNLLGDSDRVVGGLAVDDVHRGRDIFMGWTWIKAEKLTVEAVMESLRKGCYYASCGPKIEDFRIEGDKAVVECSPAAQIHFVGQRNYGFSYYSDDGELMRRAEFELRDGLKYVRIEVVGENGDRAWANPIVF